MMAAATFELDDQLGFKVRDQAVEVALQLVDEPLSGRIIFLQLLADR